MLDTHGARINSCCVLDVATHLGCSSAAKVERYAYASPYDKSIGVLSVRGLADKCSGAERISA
jgi:hypothetical protein